MPTPSNTPVANRAPAPVPEFPGWVALEADESMQAGDVLVCIVGGGNMWRTPEAGNSAVCQAHAGRSIPTLGLNPDSYRIYRKAPEGPKWTYYEDPDTLIQAGDVVSARGALQHDWQTRDRMIDEFLKVGARSGFNGAHVKGWNKGETLADERVSWMMPTLILWRRRGALGARPRGGPKLPGNPHYAKALPLP